MAITIKVIHSVDCRRRNATPLGVARSAWHDWHEVRLRGGAGEWRQPKELSRPCAAVMSAVSKPSLNLARAVSKSLRALLGSPRRQRSRHCRLQCGNPDRSKRSFLIVPRMAAGDAIIATSSTASACRPGPSQDAFASCPVWRGTDWTRQTELPSPTSLFDDNLLR